MLVSPEGHVLTVWSYVLDTDYITVTLNDGRRFDAELVAADPRLELAVLKIDADDLPYFNLSESVEASAGTRVLAFSNLYGVATGDEAASVQHGSIAVVTNLEARHGAFETPYNGPVHVLDAMTNNPGAAGGVLTNRRGDLLGMLGKELRNSLNNTWLNYSIPMGELAPTVNKMILGEYEGSVTETTGEQRSDYPLSLDLLGIVLVPNVLERTPPFIDQIRSSTPAYAGGLRPDDLLIFVNGRLIQSCNDLFDELTYIDRADPVEISVMRNNEFIEFTLQGALAASATAQDDLVVLEDQAMQAAVERVAPSVVRVETVGGLDRVGQVLVGTGPTTGLIVTPDGYIVSSAFNFAQKPASIVVTLPDGSRAPATLVATDHSRMITLLKVEVEEPLPTPEVAPSDSVNIGQWAIAVGRTFPGDQPNMSVGIVSAENRIWNKALQTDAKISPSNYGGPLIDVFGRVLGVLVPLSPSGTDESAGVEWYDSGIGFGIPLEHIQEILPRLRSGDDLHAGQLGIALRNKSPLSGPVVLAAAIPNSPASKAGLKADDRIIEVDGAPVEWLSQLYQQIRPKYAGDTAHVVVMRDDQRLEFEVELVESIEPYAQPFLGILPRRDSPEGEGVAVRYVYPDSPAFAAGVQEGDVIVGVGENKIADRQELTEAFATLQPGDEVSLVVQRDSAELQFPASLASVPESIPAELPQTSDTAIGEAVEIPPVGNFQLRVPEFANDSLVFVPEDYDPRIPYGLLVWLDGAEPAEDELLLDRWKERAAQANLILLAPRSAVAGKWTRLDLPFVLKAINQVQQNYNIDDARVVLHGQQSGGVMAYALAINKRDVVRGVAVVDAPLMAEPPGNEPLLPLAVYSATLEKSPAAVRIRKGIAALKDKRYPLTERELDSSQAYLNEQQLDELTRWIDSLDRI
ncbi:unnamed protein product [Cladocopium goreaui]|uniref:Probable periplasmic serine endoprotease DegP-like (59 kDa immunogenic protein) (Protease Do ) (SK59) n=1 Tax=Cladocopium goreaui TaxID=2562237 RepID=A0A9P1BER9_9DINO|nr:unnamed protein product [Cladocopium goreaui]